MNNVNILIVDDQPENLQILTLMLDELGHRVRIANSGEKALSEIKKEIPHLILLDIMMPGMDGYEVCEHIKANGNTAEIPIIFISALADPQDRIKAFKVGGVDYIAKPFNISEVVARVEAHLRIQQQQQEIHELYDRNHTQLLKLQQAFRHLNLLHQLTSTSDVTHSLKQVSGEICHKLYEAFGAQRVFAFLINAEQTKVTVHAEFPPEAQPSMINVHLDLSDNALYDYLRDNQKPYPSNDVRQDSLLQYIPKIDEDWVRSLLVMPAQMHHRFIGMVFICYEKAHEFTEEEIELAEKAGFAAAQSLENSTLHHQLKVQNQQLGQTVAERTDQLNRLNRRMATVLASVTDAIILANDDGTIDITNKSFNTLFGYSPDELFLQPLHQIIQPAYHEVIAEAFESARAGNIQSHIEVEAVCKDGSTIDIDISFAQTGDEENHIVCNCHDISRLKEMERVKDNFVSMVTHELRTPISGIFLIANGFRKYFDRMTEEQRSRKVDQLYTQSKIMAELVESVLDISRLESRNYQRNIEYTSLSAKALQIVEEINSMATEKEQFLEFVNDETPYLVAADSVDIARIWRNLISNAIKYTQEGGEITVRAGTIHVKNDGHLDLSPALAELHGFSDDNMLEGMYCAGQVEDNGYGIAEEDLPNLFERFYRGWAKRSNIPGTGLGLSLVKELLVSYGGNIHVKSTENYGTIFTFWLPAAIEEE